MAANDHNTNAMSAPPVVQCSGVVKIYEQGGEEIRPLDGLDLRVSQGEYIALMGPSGSGKSTLLNLLIGIDKASSGQLVVAGQDLSMLGRSRMARWRNKHLGVIFQQYHLVPVLTAAENIELPLRLSGLSRSARKDRVAVALAAVGLVDRADHLPSQLSGGQQQRVAIARAFVTDPDLIVADEPTGNLDRGSVDVTLDLLTRLHQEFGKTLVMVTHDPHAAAIADTTYFLDAGQLSADPDDPQAAALARAVQDARSARATREPLATAASKTDGGEA